VDIGAHSPAVLSNIAFNSASKRHRPNLKLGQVLIGHVICANRFLEVEISCEDPTSQKDWVTNEVYFGGLPEGGLLLDLAVAVTRKLQDRNCAIMPILGQYMKPFELAIGCNGKIYIKTDEGQNLRAVLIAECLRKAVSTPPEEFETMCQMMERKLRH
jgi:exosome complex component RRP40